MTEDQSPPVVGTSDEPSRAELIEVLRKLDAHIDFSEGLEPGEWGVADPSGLNEAFAKAAAALRLAEWAGE